MSQNFAKYCFLSRKTSKASSYPIIKSLIVQFHYELCAIYCQIVPFISFNSNNTSGKHSTIMHKCSNHINTHIDHI